MLLPVLFLRFCNYPMKHHFRFFKMYNLKTSLLLFLAISFSCNKSVPNDPVSKKNIVQNFSNANPVYEKRENDLLISRAEYKNRLHGFWLGQSIANWTGLVTEMDKIGNIGEIRTGDFYTREDWGKPDQPSIWGEGVPSDLSPTIDFVTRGPGEVWGADDDTDIEYIYQHLLLTNRTSLLSPEQIREGWLKHIRAEEENYLWVSNQKAFDLMRQGLLPPETGHPEHNEHYMMIDAQLTTEIFGFFAPGRPDIALEMAHLPIRTVSRQEASWISEFYVIMYSLAVLEKEGLTLGERLRWMAGEARKRLPERSYTSKMFDFVKAQYDSGLPWEEARDRVYERYQVRQEDGYDLTSKKLYCNGCFAAGINFASSLISLFYGEGDLQETIRIGVLAGWDADNPTATWGGLLGFMLGKDGVEKAFGQSFSEKFHIHRTRQNFPDAGMDTFDNMANSGVLVVDRVVQEQMRGSVDLEHDLWYIPVPDASLEIQPAGD